MLKNPDDPNAKLFSILNKLENYRDKDGNFRFKLCYPVEQKCNEWTQSSNLAENNKIEGFSPISLDWTENGDRKPWRGLGKVGSNSFGTTLIDDAPESTNWFCAIGAFAYWPVSPKIPGPNTIGGGISEVILYVYIN